MRFFILQKYKVFLSTESKFFIVIPLQDETSISRNYTSLDKGSLFTNMINNGNKIPHKRLAEEPKNENFNFAIHPTFKTVQMLTAIIPKLPMRNKSQTKEFYLAGLGFDAIADYENYLLLQKEGIELHFFEFTALDPKQNYGQVYIRTNAIDQLYGELQDKHIPIHPNGHLEIKPWGQKEFALLDPSNNLLTFGQSIR